MENCSPAKMLIQETVAMLEAPCLDNVGADYSGVTLPPQHPGTASGAPGQWFWFCPQRQHRPGKQGPGPGSTLILTDSRQRQHLDLAF